MSSVKASPRVPLRSPAALLAMTTAEAPAAYAFCALSAKVQLAAADQGDAAGREAGEVGGLAARRRVGRRPGQRA